MYIERTLSTTLIEASRMFKVLLLTGPRQVGKTTLLMHLKEESRTYVTLDDTEALMLAKNEPSRFFDAYPMPILIDEIQRAPELFLEIKRRLDASEKKGQVWLTGSQQFALMRAATESLAGRVGILNLQGLSQSERLHEKRPAFHPEGPHDVKNIFESKSKIFEAIVGGSFPQLVDNRTDRELFLRSYVQTYLERDVREITQVSNLLTFSRFLKAVAARTAQVLNYNDLSRDIGISVNTAKAWTNILWASGLVTILAPYSMNIGKRLTKTPKVYFLDTGLCCYLCGIHDGKVAEEGTMSGALLETYVVSEILKSYWHQGREGNFSFYRDTQQHEIDLVLEEGGKCYPIEIKSTEMPTVRMAQIFRSLPEEIRGKGAIMCMSRGVFPVAPDIDAIPVGMI